MGNKQQTTRDVFTATITKLMMKSAKKLGVSQKMVEQIMRKTEEPAHKRKAFGNYQPTKHDLFVCNFAKSGTNWMMQIAQQIAYYGDASFDHIHDLIAWPDSPNGYDVISIDDPTPQKQAPTGLRIVKTHLESDYIPYSSEAKYMLAIRDPKDVVVSGYHFAKPMFDVMGVTHDGTSWLRAFLLNLTPFGSWSEHTASYWTWRTRPNVLLFTFREMKQDLPTACKKIAHFMGVDLTPAQLQKVIQKSEFQYMKSQDSKFAPRLSMLTENKPAMMRQGKIGVADSLLTEKQQANLDTFCQMELARLGSDFPYQAIFIEQSLTFISDSSADL